MLECNRIRLQLTTIYYKPVVCNQPEIRAGYNSGYNFFGKKGHKKEARLTGPPVLLFVRIDNRFGSFFLKLMEGKFVSPHSTERNDYRVDSCQKGRIRG